MNNNFFVSPETHISDDKQLIETIYEYTISLIFEHMTMKKEVNNYDKEADE